MPWKQLSNKYNAHLQFDVYFMSSDYPELNVMFLYYYKDLFQLQARSILKSCDGKIKRYETGRYKSGSQNFFSTEILDSFNIKSWKIRNISFKI